MKTRTHAACSLLTAALAGAAGPARAEGLAIDHQPVECIVAGVFPRLDACFAPVGAMARARVHFRAQGTPHWYFVDMSAPGGCRSVLLPKPLPTTRAIEYYVSAVDRAFAETRTRDHAPRVVAREGDCDRDLLVAGGAGSAVVLLGAVAGAPAVPPGFDSAGIVAAPPGAGGSAPAAQKGAGGGGAGTLLLLGALGAGGYFAYDQLKEDEPPEPSSPFDGEWQGLTSQERPVRMSVSGGVLTRFDSSVASTSANVPFTIPIERTFSPGLALSGGAFSFLHGTAPAITVTGTLNASGAAEGRFDAGGRTIATWRAEKR